MPQPPAPHTNTRPPILTRIRQDGVSLLVILLAVLAFTLLAGRNLAAQGLYYDEVHEVTASFSYLGRAQFEYSTLVIRGIPVLDMPYTGAIKTALYGLYMKVFDASFSVLSLRLMGILVVVAGWLAFGLLLGKRIPLPGLAAFFLLGITDISLLLTTRHDWGPVAITLALRLAFLGLWLRADLSGKVRPINSFGLGFLVALSVFEKLSSAVLLIPLVLLLLSHPQRRRFRHLLAAGLGLFVGSLPLLIANLYTYTHSGYLVSLSFQPQAPVHSLGGILDLFKSSLALGAGQDASGFILGVGRPLFGTLEGWGLLALLLLGIGLALRMPPGSPTRRLVFVLTASYFLVLLAVFLLPQPTWLHHWILATPFQYLAIALAAGAGWQARRKLPALLLNLALAAFLLVRLAGVVALEGDLAHGRSSTTWTPELTRMAEFAGTHVQDALFIAGDWGLAAQMICFTNGTPGVIREVYDRSGLPDAAALIGMIRASPRDTVYLVFLDPPVFTPNQARGELVGTIAAELAPDWVLVPDRVLVASEPDLMGLEHVLVYKLVRQ